MLFNSYQFIFLFLPFLILILTFFQNYVRFKNLQILIMILFSLFFYAYDNYKFLFLILFSIFVNYYISLKIDSLNKKNLKKLSLTLIILFNILILFYFKYFNFFIKHISSFFSETNISYIEIYLPLAISFFTFQQISYQVDNFRNKKKKNIISYILYVSFFPQLISGPIIRYSHFLKETIKDKFLKINNENLSIGLSIIVLGLFKKVVLADTAGLYVDDLYNQINDGKSFNGFDLLLFIVFFSVQIYFDFSGYSDIAVGIAKILNFNLPINFNSPYKAHSIIDFWKRWHITLSQFFRDYFYISLGGNKNIFIVKFFLIIFVMTVVGLWHGASNNFVIWGLIHGLLISFNHLINKFNFKKFINLSIPKFIKIAFTFMLVAMAFVFFRVENLHQSLTIIIGSLSIENYFHNSYFINEISNYKKLIMILSIFIIFFMPNIFQIFNLKLVNLKKIDKNQKIVFKINYFWIYSIILIFIFLLTFLNSMSVFIYFRF
ncbi:MAG: membrane-bound O-acyltransferase family protein [Flavobacteriaceae bacterium]|nr:membrane-bound O-acyltransferase family protein [Flavobacteriaceae bacterium]